MKLIDVSNSGGLARVGADSACSAALTLSRNDGRLLFANIPSNQTASSTPRDTMQQETPARFTNVSLPPSNRMRRARSLNIRTSPRSEQSLTVTGSLSFHSVAFRKGNAATAYLLQERKVNTARHTMVRTTPHRGRLQLSFQEHYASLSDDGTTRGGQTKVSGELNTPGYATDHL